MYLSQLTLNPRSRRVMGECRDPYQMHRTLCRAWGDECKAAQILYRIEQEKALTLLVQSHLEPDWGFLQEGDYLLKSPQMKPFEPQLKAGQRLTFRLRANPTKSAVEPEQTSGRGKRVGLFREAERRDWLLRQGARCGFEIPVIAVTKDQGPVYDLRQLDERALTASPEGPARDKRAVLSSVLFEGRLEITDAAVFQAALQNGIGRGKAFGFGLLSLRRG